MKVANPYSPLIRRMRDERRTRIPRFRQVSGGVPPGVALTPSAVPPITLDLRLDRLKNDLRFARLLDVDDPAELDAVLADIQTLIIRCDYHHRSAQSQRAMNNRRAVRNWRAAQFPVRRPGRPPGAQNFASRQFGLGLAMIWLEHTGRRPSRYEPERIRERGSYSEFVQMVVLALPPSSRRMPSGFPPEVDYLVRASVTDFRAAVQSPEEYRRRGLIDEQHWLGRDDAAH